MISWSRERVLDTLEELAEELGKTPRSTDDPRLTKAAKRYFGSWRKALKVAGFEPRRYRRWSKDEIIEKLKDLADELGKSPTFEDARERGLYYHNVRKHFDSWNEAKEVAGLETFSRARNPKLEVLGAVKKEGVVTVSELSEHFDVSRQTIHDWLRKLKKETEIMTSYPQFGVGMGGARYKEKHLFNSDYTSETYVYLNPIEFAKFFEENILKVDLHENIDKGIKQTLTAKIESKFPDKAVEYLRKKYVKALGD